MTKSCWRCKKVQTIGEFISLQNGKEVKTCMNCRNKSRKYHADKKSTKSKLYLHYQSLKVDMGGKCAQCGDSELTHLDFDHIDSQNKCKSVIDCKTGQKMEEEAKKCQLLCLKCHRVKSIRDLHKKWANHIYSQKKSVVQLRKRRERNKNHVNRVKISLGGCQNPDCNDTFDQDALEFYEFDHIDAKTKIRAVSSMVCSGLAIKTIDEEIAKCRLLCGYCHRVHTKNIAACYMDETTPHVAPKIRRKNKKLTDDQVLEIRKKWSSGQYSTRVEIAKEYNVHKATISAILLDRTRTSTPKKPTKRVPKLSSSDVEHIRQLAKNPDMFYRDIGELFGVTKQYVYDIVSGRRKIN